ncbi:bacteriochlorophyll 4-vinyl reductase [Meridianimarinicoccus sp. RP-17]|uniref:bacteriochlorophyll 4-vinyl reductase n=1 Tax=Meridianimarinicoccus zhengii TaxID=2056810 RepID=UPI000DAF1084|nr:bacteriochlorophyll 4-vinyl reductase [Phycocomes zhengii]
MDGGAHGFAQARIGPNAVLQLVPVLDRTLGRPARVRLLTGAGLFEMPDGTAMIDEGPVARLHQTMRRDFPDLAPGMAAAAGRRTGDYILIHRIPRRAQRLLRILPAALSARLLAQAIAQHAWTFAGSGRFRVASRVPLVFEIADNPLVRGEHAAAPVCHWHVAVFARLFTRLAAPDYTCVETDCCANGARACRFVLARAA